MVVVGGRDWGYSQQLPWQDNSRIKLCPGLHGSLGCSSHFPALRCFLICLTLEYTGKVKAKVECSYPELSFSSVSCSLERKSCWPLVAVRKLWSPMLWSLCLWPPLISLPHLPGFLISDPGLFIPSGEDGSSGCQWLEAS